KRGLPPPSHRSSWPLRRRRPCCRPSCRRRPRPSPWCTLSGPFALSLVLAVRPPVRPPGSASPGHAPRECPYALFPRPCQEFRTPAGQCHLGGERRHGAPHSPRDVRISSRMNPRLEQLIHL